MLLLTFGGITVGVSGNRAGSKTTVSQDCIDHAA
jgi:hypothetical protein